MKLEREFLCELRNTANEAAQTEGLNQGWKRVYLNLSDAANFLDAMLARTEIVVTDE